MIMCCVYEGADVESATANGIRMLRTRMREVPGIGLAACGAISTKPRALPVVVVASPNRIVSRFTFRIHVRPISMSISVRRYVESVPRTSVANSTNG
jgi:hypothetical protein